MLGGASYDKKFSVQTRAPPKNPRELCAGRKKSLAITHLQKGR